MTRSNARRLDNTRTGLTLIAGIAILLVSLAGITCGFRAALTPLDQAPQQVAAR